MKEREEQILKDFNEGSSTSNMSFKEHINYIYKQHNFVVLHNPGPATFR
jgi:hypothetical protein